MRPRRRRAPPSETTLDEAIAKVPIKEFEKILAKLGELCKKQFSCVWTADNIRFLRENFAEEIKNNAQFRDMVEAGPCGLPLPKYKIDCKILVHRTYHYRQNAKKTQKNIQIGEVLKCTESQRSRMIRPKIGSRVSSDRPEAWESIDILPSQIAEVFDALHPYTVEKLGFRPGGTHPRQFVTEVMVVSSPQVRPTVASSSGSRNDDDLTYFYKEVLRAKKEFQKREEEYRALRDKLEEEHEVPSMQQRLIDLADMIGDEEPCEDDEQLMTDLEIRLSQAEEKIEALCRDAQILMEVARKLLAARCADVVKPDHSAKLIIPHEEKVLGHRKRRAQNNRKSLHGRLGGKQGRFRKNLMGKRVDFCARSPVGPAPPDFEAWQLGVPEYVCKTLTFPERATRFSLDRLRQCVTIGPKEMGGATFVKRPDPALGREEIISLALMSPEERSEFAKEKLAVGDVVERHLQEDDWGMFNRQPTLHRGSWQAFRLRPTKSLNFQLPPEVTQPFNADFDGDEMNLHMARTLPEIAECQELMCMPRNIRGVGTNAPRCGLIQADNVAGFVMSKTDRLFTREDAC